LSVLTLLSLEIDLQLHSSIAAGRHRNWLELKRIPRPAFLLRATENTEDTEVLFPVSSVQPLGSIGEEGGVVKWAWQERGRGGDRETGRRGEGERGEYTKMWRSYTKMLIWM